MILRVPVWMRRSTGKRHDAGNEEESNSDCWDSFFSLSLNALVKEVQALSTMNRDSDNVIEVLLTDSKCVFISS